ncbi:hypothetical protein CMMCA002_01865 [Clavibacter michiganensis subsp. michiganensis]|nr:hypothetical protein CMMCA002_01865 [Clavibacter michiganensis subsp. michiganensis]
MNSSTRTLPGRHTGAISSTASFTEMACSWISFASDRSSSRSRRDSIRSATSARVPASGWVRTVPRASTATTISGLKPTASIPPRPSR